MDPITERIESHAGADPQQAVALHYVRLEQGFEAIAMLALAECRFDDWQVAIGWQDRIAKARRSEISESVHWSLASLAGMP